MSVFCVIPAYNEEKNIIDVVRGLEDKVDFIVIVDDKSLDNTVDVLNNNIKSDKIIVLEHIVNRGQGASLRTGTEYAIKNNADIIVHFDADGQFLSEDIKVATDCILENKMDVVFGSRFLGKESNMPFLKKKIIMPLARLVNRIFFNLNLSDPQSGFRVMTSDAAKEINWQQDRMAHCSEILFLAHKRGLNIAEVPITVIYNDFGQRLGGGFKILKELLLGKLIY